MSKKKSPEAEARTKEELLAVATRVFLRDGYEAASMKAIADEGDCTTGKLYSNYTKKEDFLASFAKKLLQVNYDVASNVVRDGDHPMMSYLVTAGLVVETCRLNENFHELYYVGYSGRDTMKSFIEGHSKKIIPVLEMCGIMRSEEEIFANGLMVAGIMRSLVASEYLGVDMPFETKMKHFVFASMAIMGFEDKDAKLVYDTIIERQEAIHEAAYGIIIKALSGKF